MDYLENRMGGDVVNLIYEKLHKNKFKDTLKQFKEQDLEIPEVLKGIFEKDDSEKYNPLDSHYNIDWYKSYFSLIMELKEDEKELLKELGII